ncbi:UDP-galactopyranose mutase [Desulfopila aestuarii]|uniref:UDP-galactopyranose mutase n=1 Tax=Desulfopila aestuarii DSM 18488 TaxID=1121416 RepID=A0A1M7Y219_9BACT|nr:UDP-galactopyranose mutase [Desulfopila aestuarii]SHO45768.1 UDP-galactopyranose mutase [Desulfopila aestuarii DSM 18488]
MSLADSDFIIVGAGLYGSTIAERLANEYNLSVMILEQRNHLGGNCYSTIHQETGIEYHQYGTHIFHTSNETVWNYIHRFTHFNGYYHQVLTTYKDQVYQMPINLETINSFYGVNLKPFEVRQFLAREIAKENILRPQNLEEKAISLLGRPLYEAFIKGYTIKQWQKHPRDLPTSILTRIPFRTNYNENYFHDKWQGIPEDGYAAIFQKMLSHPKIQVHLNTDFFSIRDQLPQNTVIVYSGPIDRFFEYKFGKLEWRTLRFEKEVISVEDYQGISVMNYAEETVPYTRIHEPRHLHPERNYPQNETLIIREYSDMDDGSAPYYPINDEKNRKLLLKYHDEAKKHPNVFFSGRLGEYKYLDMHQTIENALDLFETRLCPLFRQ